ncbi:MAG: response regulator [Planctomycetaceae bacterium]
MTESLPEQGGAPAPPQATEPLVLVVDDEVPFAKRLGLEFVEAGFRADALHSGADALAYAARERPDLIVLDVRMPGMDGLECLHRLRAAPFGRSTPVILLTGEVTPRVDVAALLHEGCLVVSKPCSYRTVIRIATRMLATV